MAGVPPGREGTSNVYAFNTINAAAQRADILVRSAASEPGNYMQTLTHTNFQKDSSVMFADVDAPQFEQARYLIDQNRQFVQKEVINYINFAFPTKLILFTYPTLSKYLLSLEQSRLSPIKKK